MVGKAFKTVLGGKLPEEVKQALALFSPDLTSLLFTSP